MPALNDWRDAAERQLKSAGIPSARLDAELILTHTIKKPRTYLHAHPDAEIDSRTHEILNARLDLRLDRVPLAYIIGHKEFYGRRFRVDSTTLIPRPESEALIEILKTLTPAEPPLDSRLAPKIVDVGTGSGILGITAKLERPHCEVVLLDVSRPALNVAAKNATNLGAEVQIIKSDLLSDYPYTADIMLANLPYVDENWHNSPELQHEPSLALYASDGGLKLIKKLLEAAPLRLTKTGIVILEADRRQHQAIIDFAAKLGYQKRARTGLVLALQFSPATPDTNPA